MPNIVLYFYYTGYFNIPINIPWNSYSETVWLGGACLALIFVKCNWSSAQSVAYYYWLLSTLPTQWPWIFKLSISSVASKHFEWLFPQPQGVSSGTCSGRYSAKGVLQISRVCLFFFSLYLPLPVPYPLWYSILTTPAALLSQLSLYNSGHQLVLFCIKA